MRAAVRLMRADACWGAVQYTRLSNGIRGDWQSVGRIAAAQVVLVESSAIAKRGKRALSCGGGDVEQGSTGSLDGRELPQ